jgi:hypothetical protein
MFRRYKFFSFVAILCIYNCNILNLNAAEYSTNKDVTSKEVFTKYEQYLKNMEHCSFSFHDVIGDKDISSPAGMFKYSYPNYSYFINKKLKDGNFFESIEKNLFKGKKIHIVKLADKRVVFKVNTLSPTTKQQAEFENVKTELPFPVLLGYVPIDFSKEEKILDMIRKNNFQFKILQNNKTAELFYEGKIGNIQFKFWFASEYGYALTKVSMSNESSNVDLGYNSFEIELTGFTRCSNTDFFFPTRYNMIYLATATYEQQDKDKQGKIIDVPYTQEGRLVYEFSNFKIDKDDTEKEFPIMSKIDNGTDVSVGDTPQIQYVWMDGKIVPKTDEVMLAIARGGHKFIPGPNESRFWFIALGLFLMFLGGGLKLYSMLKGK